MLRLLARALRVERCRARAGNPVRESSRGRTVARTRGRVRRGRRRWFGDLPQPGWHRRARDQRRGRQSLGATAGVARGDGRLRDRARRLGPRLLSAALAPAVSGGRAEGRAERERRSPPARARRGAIHAARSSVPLREPAAERECGRSSGGAPRRQRALDRPLVWLPHPPRRGRRAERVPGQPHLPPRRSRDPRPRSHGRGLGRSRAEPRIHATDRCAPPGLPYRDPAPHHAFAAGRVDVPGAGHRALRFGDDRTPRDTRRRRADGDLESCEPTIAPSISRCHGSCARA